MGYPAPVCSHSRIRNSRRQSYAGVWQVLEAGGCRCDGCPGKAQGRGSPPALWVALLTLVGPIPSRSASAPAPRPRRCRPHCGGLPDEGEFFRRGVPFRRRFWMIRLMGTSSDRGLGAEKTASSVGPARFARVLAVASGRRPSTHPPPACQWPRSNKENVRPIDTPTNESLRIHTGSELPPISVSGLNSLVQLILPAES